MTVAHTEWQGTKTDYAEIKRSGRLVASESLKTMTWTYFYFTMEIQLDRQDGLRFRSPDVARNRDSQNHGGLDKTTNPRSRFEPDA